MMIILKIFLEEGDGVERNFDVPVTPTTKCNDVISLVKEPGGDDSHLVLLWRGQEVPINNEENLYDVIQQWDEYKTEVKFVLRCDDPEPPPLPPPPSHQSQEEFHNFQYGQEQIPYQYSPVYPEGDPRQNYGYQGEVIPHVSDSHEYQRRYEHEESVDLNNSDGLLQISEISVGIQDQSEERFSPHHGINGEITEEISENDPSLEISDDLEGRKGYQRNGMRDNQPLREMLPGGVDLTLSELQDMASRQQQQIEHQQQVLVAKEQRLKYLKQQEHRQQQIKAENDRLKKLRDKVESQEMKLKKLRALRGEVEKHKNTNGSLNSELESVKALFTEKEKELVMAVAKVEEMTRQLEHLHQERGNVNNGTQSSAALELDKLRQELMIRNKLNDQQNSKLNAHKQMLIQRKDEIAKMDNRIYELQQRLKKKRAQQADKNLNNKKLNEDKNINKPTNVAAVEPYIQRMPSEQKNDLDIKKGFTKQDPKYQTLPPNLKFPLSDNNNKTRSDDNGAKEQNNNIPGKQEKLKSSSNVDNSENKNDQNGMSHKVSESIIKAAQRHQTTNGGAIVTSSGHSNKAPPPPVPARSGTTGLSYFTPRPFGSTYSTSVLSNRTRVSELPQTGPTINVQDEVRTGGSGQSSPASSDSSQKDSQPPKQVETSKHLPGGNVSNKQDNGAPPTVGRRQLPNNPDSQPFSHKKYNNVDHTDSSHLLKSSSEFPANKNDTKSKDMHPEGRNVSPTEVKTSDSNGANGNNSSKQTTYKYASKNQIANTYMGRLGPEALQKYQKSLNMLYKNLVTDDNSQSQTKSEQSEERKESNSNAKENKTDNHSPSDTPSGSFQTFTPPGSPQYPDMTSDKVSHNRNTPKTIRRRHSDSDNEDISKLIHKYVDRHNTHQNVSNASHNNYSNDQVNMLLDTQATSFRGGIPENVPVDSMGNLVDIVENDENSVESNKNSNYVNVKPPSPKEGQTTVSKGATGHRKKTNLRTRNSKSSGNRVSFDPLALLLDASLEGEVELVRTCASQVVNVSESNDEGITALHNAICAGHYDIVTFLVEFGCDANSPDSDGWTPLHCAASCNNLPMVIFLVEHGACIFATTISDHETAAEKCEEDEDGFDGCSEYLYNVQEKLGIMNGGIVYAVFDYEAQNSDELSFSINDEISVLRKGDENEKEWWWSKIGDREGYVPRNLLGLYPRVLPKDHSRDS